MKRFRRWATAERRSVLRALRPDKAPLAIFPALRALFAAGVLALAGVATRDFDTVGVAYFGASCAVVFITTPAYRTRLVMLIAQASGAVTGICLGVLLPHEPFSIVTTAILAGMLSGILGAIASAWTAAALMFLVGLSFGQFAGLALPWWQQGAWYLVGTVVVAVPALILWPRHRDEKSPCSHARSVAVVDRPLPRPLFRRLLDALRPALNRNALGNGLRLALCLGLASATVIALREPSHSYWLPLTVAVIVRPEYASVFVRTVNRIAGTVAGAITASVILFVAPGAWFVAIGAALAIGFAVLAAPRSYGLSVVGITASALLSASIGTPDPAFPLSRVLDTVLGALIAIVFGYLLWPRKSG